MAEAKAKVPFLKDEGRQRRDQAEICPACSSSIPPGPNSSKKQRMGTEQSILPFGTMLFKAPAFFPLSFGQLEVVKKN